MAFAIKIKPGTKVRLDSIDPRGDASVEKAQGIERVTELGLRLKTLQELMYATGKHALLIVLQGRDTAGKDGAIRKILDAVNVQSTRVVPFKVPTAPELARDFLWRIHQQVPERGGMTIFNRSHYEDVLVVRVHGLAPPKVWGARYAHINDFERLLTDCGTHVVKFMLHIDADEQEKRLLAREQDPDKGWKLAVADWKEREHWDAYTAAYDEALMRCSTDHAPWYVVPANRKWYRDLAIFETLVDTLDPMARGWKKELAVIGERSRKAIEEYRASRDQPS